MPWPFGERSSTTRGMSITSINDGDQNPLGAACIRKDITYKEDDLMGLKDQTFMGGSVRISALDVVDLRRDIWRQAFPDVQPED